MCDKKQFDYCPSTIDPCMRGLIKYLQSIKVKTLGCCCGHGRYPMTIIVEGRKGKIIEAISGKEVFRSRRFYKKDDQGYYFIPEVSEEKKGPIPVEEMNKEQYKDLLETLWLEDDVLMRRNAVEELGFKE